MIEIRPVSDLRNNYPQIEELVLNGNKPVYLTKNGHGSMVLMSIEEYSRLEEIAKNYEELLKAKSSSPKTPQQIDETYKKLVNRISGK